MEKGKPTNIEITKAYSELERCVFAALETYSNVHRGSGHNSLVTTHLYEQARDIVLEYLGLNKSKYTLIFCSPARAADITAQLEPGSYQSVSSRDIGLSIGVQALAVKKSAMPKGTPLQSGGGTARLVSRDWVVWAKSPDKFEAGTPAIINTIAFAKALLLVQKYGKEIFREPITEKLPVTEILYHDELENFSGQELLDKLRQTLIGRDIQVPTMEGSKPFINLDNSASTPTFTPIWNTFRQVLQQPEEVKQEIIREVKIICGGMLGAPPAAFDVIFTSNTTEAINLATESFSRESEEGVEPVVLSTILEHSSNDLPWRMVPGCSLIRLTVDGEGFIDLKEMETLLAAYNLENQFGKKRIRLVAISGASNVLGICNNIEQISNIVHRYGARLLVDAAQLVAHRKVDMEGCGIDYLAFSAHKVYAPFGCGVLVVKKGLLTLNSEKLELIRSSGDENTAGIAALGKALLLLQRIGMDLVREEEQALTARLLRGLSQIDGLKVCGVKDPDAAAFSDKIGVVVFNLKSMMPSNLSKELALRRGIGVRYGCHCAHIIIKHLLNVSPGLERFQRILVTVFPKISLPGLLRVSLGIENSAEDVDALIQVLDEIANKQQTTTGSQSAHSQIGNAKVPRIEVQNQIKEFTKEVTRRVYS